MRAGLADALAAGAMGFSSATAATHRDGSGVPTPPTFATNEELVALAGVCRDFPGTSVEFIPASAAYGFIAEEYDLLTDMATAAGRPLNWNTVLLDYPAIPDIHERQLASADVAAAAGRGGRPDDDPAQFPGAHRFLWRATSAFARSPQFEDLFELAPAARVAALADPDVRRRLHESLEHAPIGATAMFSASLSEHIVSDSGTPALQAVVGRPVADLAAEREQSVLDVMLDLAVASELDVGFVRHLVPTATRRRSGPKGQRCCATRGWCSGPLTAVPMCAAWSTSSTARPRSTSSCAPNRSSA